MNAMYDYSHPDTKGFVSCDKMERNRLYTMIAARMSYMDLSQEIYFNLIKYLYFLSHETLIHMLLDWDNFDFATWNRSVKED